MWDEGLVGYKTLVLKMEAIELRHTSPWFLVYLLLSQAEYHFRTQELPVSSTTTCPSVGVREERKGKEKHDAGS